MTDNCNLISLSGLEKFCRVYKTRLLFNFSFRLFSFRFLFPAAERGVNRVNRPDRPRDEKLPCRAPSLVA